MVIGFGVVEPKETIEVDPEQLEFSNPNFEKQEKSKSGQKTNDKKDTK